MHTADNTEQQGTPTPRMDAAGLARVQIEKATKAERDAREERIARRVAEELRRMGQ